MAAMGGGIGAALGALGGGGGNQVMHELNLRLGSSRTPAGDPEADHFMPSGAHLGESVPLVTPREAAVRSAVMEAIYRAGTLNRWVKPRLPKD